MEANTEPTAMVDAKSKLDIFAKVLSPNILVIIIIIENMPRTEMINQIASSKFMILVFRKFSWKAIIMLILMLEMITDLGNTLNGEIH